MQVLFKILCFTLFLKHILGCYQVGVSLSNNFGSILKIQIKNNNKEVCVGDDTKFGASSNTVFTIKCKSGHTVKVWNNAKSAEIDDGNGYKSNLYPSNSKYDVYDCGKIKCSTFVSCFDDNYWNCDLYPYCSVGN